MTNQQNKKRTRKSAKSNNSKIVMVYRKSTDTDDLQQNSIEMQRVAAEIFAKNNGLEIVASFEEHQSGTVPLSQATGILDALDACKRYGASYIGFDRQDRASRSLQRWWHLRALTEELGVKIVIVKDGMPKASDEMAEVREFINAFAAQQTVKLLRGRIKEALHLKKSKGERYTNNAPTGYSWHDGKLVEDEKEQELISKIKELGSTGYGSSEISAVLWEMGYKNRKGGKLTPMFVWRILNKDRMVA